MKTSADPRYRMIVMLAVSLSGSVAALSTNTCCEFGSDVSRRSCFQTAAASLLAGITIGNTPAGAVDTDIGSEGNSVLEIKRNRLLQSITTSSQDEATVMAAIENLLPLDPSMGKAATRSEDLDGEWELLWSAKAEAFSPLLKLPKPFKPDSFQYLGAAAASEVGPDRVAQGLTGGILGQKQLWLSSGVRPSSEDASVLEILPPFRFEVGGRYGSGVPKTQVVEAGSDAEFRKLNARTSEAQAAPKNSYKQLYLEQEGKGSLRISTITAGDPVIVGAIFVHRKL